MEYLVLAGVCLLTFGLIGFAIYLLYLEYRGTNLYAILEKKLESDKMSHAERKSRERVSAIIHSNMSPMQQCLALDKEMSALYTQVTVSKQWKNIVHSLFKDIMKKNKLTLKSNKQGGTYIVSTINEGEFSKCLTTF
ncbi:MAG: hypothetical protein IJZ68_08535 [Bacteroidaceae bacterium]|nr:hypothetical protein [Bacteroidaceae bacterium]